MSVKHRLVMAAIRLCGTNRASLRRLLRDLRREERQLHRFIMETAA